MSRPWRVPGARGRRIAQIAFAALWIGMASSAATRIFRDAPALEGALDGTNEPDAANYAAAPRLAANGVRLERTHTFYALHTAPLTVFAAPLARLAPADSHRAIRLGTVALHAILAGVVGWGVIRGGRSPWALAALAGWCLSPGIWGIARLAYSEYFVGLALWLALTTLPVPGASLPRVALGGLGTGVLLTAKAYGAVPLVIFALILLREDLRRRKAPTRALVFAAVAALAAAGTWGLACALLGIAPVTSFGEFVADILRFRAEEGLDLLATLETLPRVLAARLPGYEWHGVVLLACLRWGARPGGFDLRRATVWLACFVAPYTASPFVYRLFPLLVALPALVRTSPGTPPGARAAATRWPEFLVDTLCVANLLRLAHPDLLLSRSRLLPVVAMALVAGAWAWARARRATEDGAVALRVPALALGAAWLAMMVHGVAWQAGNWVAASPRWDESARTVARLAPHTPSVAGWLPELWCRYLPRAVSLDTMTAIAPLPESIMATSPAILVPSNHLDWFGHWLDGRALTPLDIPPVQGGAVQLQLGLLR